MQQIIKLVSPSRQHFKTINFAFMKLFDFNSQLSFFGPFWFSWVICVIDYVQKLSSVAYDLLHFRKCPLQKGKY